MVIGFLLFLLASPGPASPPIALHLVPQESVCTAIVTGPLPGAVSGPFTGSVSVNGSATELPVTGSARASGERLEVTLTLRYRDAPEEWLSRFRLGDFDYRLRGRVPGGPPVDWAGTKAWNEVQVERREDLAAKFVRLGTLELTEISLLSSAAKAAVVVKNPLGFPLKIVNTTYRVFANGREVGSGAAGEMRLAPAQETTLDLPVALDHSQLLAAAGSALATGGEIAGRLNGTLVLRLKTADVPVPLDLSGRFAASR